MHGRGAEAEREQNPLRKKWVQHSICRVRFETVRSKPSLSSRNGRCARVRSASTPAIIKIRQLWDQIRPSCLFNGNSYSGKTHLYIELTPCHFMVIVAMALMCIPGASFNMSMSSYQYRNPIVEIRWSYDHLISKMGFPILVRWHLYVELAPRK